MPELPEVETIRLGLMRVLPGKIVKTIDVRIPKLFRGDPHFLVGRSISQIRRRAKVLIIDFDNDHSLLIHLKMTGQLVYQSPDEQDKVVGGHPQAAYNQPMPHSHTHVIFNFTDGRCFFTSSIRVVFNFYLMFRIKIMIVLNILYSKTFFTRPLTLLYSCAYSDKYKEQALIGYQHRLVFIGLK